ncbi:phage tail sheath family protein [Trinickia soli]|uniref:Phage tail protein n=1 Tax=Trinickia soli TaxID=380675 RepID=A0A2N7WEH3_9BURK|nr:phage tail sheath C-terminal domain-containing protein [Trinickia soli]KAA0086341.1 phage tail sheath family protein [Paraburkholderia sp. T12-10]PMS27787.1 phage tail protein [Trinickia soli]CAB3656938.1 hypothetical protein LMG24076_01235 [Trinickia soli]
MAQYKVPGVYIVEKDAFPNSVVEVATAVPAFIGYTESAANGNDSLIGVPWPIQSMADYERYFGGAPAPAFDFAAGEKGASAPYTLTAGANSQFLLYYSLRMYFDNGGGPCYIVSTGLYTKQQRAAQDFLDVLGALTRTPEPTMLVAPDVVLLSDASKVPPIFLGHCNTMQSRVSIFDVPGGDKVRGVSPNDQIENFRSSVGTDFLNYGMAYYPWINTQIVDSVDFTAISPATLGAFATALTADVTATLTGANNQAKLTALTAKIGEMQKLVPAPAADGAKSDDATPATPPSPQQIMSLHNVLRTSSKLYVQVMDEIQTRLNLLPPSGAIAGIYGRVDASQGVFKAPANVSINSTVSPTVNLSDYEQEDLNVPLDGKAVNAIRAFRGMGTLVWGARTLDGNSQDWRYINVRRTLIMLEQSIKYAMQAYVFAPNTATTWVTVQNMIENFLTNQWKAGALSGAKPSDAFSVAIGQPATMTGDDVLNGLMKVLVKVAPVRPAEFIELTFQQQMQTS